MYVFIIVIAKSINSNFEAICFEFLSPFIFNFSFFSSISADFKNLSSKSIGYDG